MEFDDGIREFATPENWINWSQNQIQSAYHHFISFRHSVNFLDQNKTITHNNLSKIHKLCIFAKT